MLDKDMAAGTSLYPGSSIEHPVSRPDSDKRTNNGQTADRNDAL
jgi:hypothetical protein